MKALKFSMAVAVGMALSAHAGAQGVAKADAQEQAARRAIVVSLEDHKLALVQDGQVRKVYAVAVGKPSTPSPVGTFTIERRVLNPTYHHGGKTVLPGPSNPVGTRWMGLSKPGYGIHGTNEPNSIGKAASHGCVRMAKADLEELFGLVRVGDTVELIGERNEETAQLFGTPGPAVNASAEPAVLAESAPLLTPETGGAVEADATAADGVLAISAME